MGLSPTLFDKGKKAETDYSFTTGLLNKVDSVKDAISFFYDFSKKTGSRKKNVEPELKFLDVNFEDLKVTDVRDLLADYKKLAKDYLELKKERS